jgi:parallel beta-helix repeat protein
LYGHFAGVETSTSERNLADANYETILDGLIDPNNDGRVSYIILSNKGQSIDNVIIDGFTVQSALLDGINLDDCNVIISNCTIRDNYYFGIHIPYGGSGLIIRKCTLTDNLYGVFNSNEALTINGSIIKNNSAYGIMLSDGSSATIINNWIYNNSNYGIALGDSVSATTIRNNTIFGNGLYGVLSYGADPIIQNCIIRGNVSGDLYIENGTFNNVNYCCLQTWRLGNIAVDPCFVNADANDYHLTYNSPCKNAGNPAGSYGDETDIDGEPRIKYGRVDIGADEYYRSPDFDRNGIVDFKDFAILANAWWTQSGDGGYNDICDLADNGKIDFGDLELFCQDWLLQTGGAQGLMFGGEGGEEMMMENNMEVGLLKVADTALSEQGAEAEQIVSSEADVKEILEWTDAIEIEVVEAGLSSPGEYEIFRQSLEKDLLDMLQSSTDEK